MHLTKLFNWHYLKQNMKKSKGVILLFLILVPVFTALVTMLSVHNISFVKVANPIELVWVNIIGLYIIPFVLSFTLFGYVYKRTSVDFINSMPINRKTIFITNTIGGIILIAIIQCVTALILWLCSMMFPHYVIFTSFIVDILIMMFVSYVFVFLVANLAMTISGTFLTQIVLTMLILFFIPFLMDTYHQFSQSETYRFLNGNTEFQHQVEVNKTEYTMPYRIFSIMVYGNDTKLYSNKSIDKMLLLGAIYFVLGMYLFYKRKMENTEESFASTSIHLIIKALTIFPMIVILNQIEAEMEWNIVLIALVIVYYFLFDLIVKKKVTFPVSIVGIVATLFILQGMYMGTQTIKKILPEKTLAKEDIKAFSVSYYPFHYRDIQEDFLDNIYIEDEQMCEYLLNAMYQQKYNDKDPTITSTLEVCFKTKTGDTLYSYVSFSPEMYDAILDKISQNNDYMTAVREALLKSKSVLIQNLDADDEKIERIISEINNTIRQMDLKQIYELQSSNTCDISLYDYANHTLVKQKFPIDITETTLKISAEILNQHTEDVIKQIQHDDTKYRSFYLQDAKGMMIESSSNFTFFSYTQEDMIACIMDSVGETFDPMQPYYVIIGNIEDYDQVYFFTNKVEEIHAMIEKERQMNRVSYDTVTNLNQ